ncbi:PepSY domain-containing protein [Spongiibacter nanhainus]|uniref:PepSY domain-containing protein n=1 Tax=Spongiibacter nanhainus TaxID=2794344 RepID=A0A7T4QY32_9GAMM|nr:PepSY domain-containing protein [Spongiibacter nanhainus]QQD16816.1 PepSY domain-containing protein [Spongiibacter nanhainus]
MMSRALLCSLPLVVALASASAAANPLLKDLGGGLPKRGLSSPLHTPDLRSSLTAREAIDIAERRYGGRAVGATQIQTGSGVAYRVRILKDNGKIKHVIIDGK